MSKIIEFYNILESHRKPIVYDPYGSRNTHCYFIHESKQNELHFFEIRGWCKIINDKLNISAVNWTVAAGPCSITIDDKNLNNFKILSCKEYHKTIKSLEYMKDLKNPHYKIKE